MADFAGKFRLTLEALNCSRTRCAQTLGVDKSVVARWANGSALPTEHNLTRITTLLRQVRADVHLGIWRLDLESFARHIDPRHAPAAAPDTLTTGRDRPSVAVLAFNNLSDDVEQEFLSDAMTEDIITALARYRSLFVVARNSSFTYKGRAVLVTHVASELGVRYVVEGSIRRVGDNLRVNAQLIDAESGGHVWAQHYDRRPTDLFAVQDEISAAVAVAIEPAIALAEQRRVLRKPPESLVAWEAYQRGLGHLAHGDEVAQARGWFERATALDDMFAPARAMLAITFLIEAGRGARAPEDSLLLAGEQIERAIELDPYDSAGPTALSWLLLARGEHAAAIEQADLALGLNQNDPRAHYVRGRALMFAGRTAEARGALLTSVRLSPRYPFNRVVLAQVTFSHYLERDYPAAADAAERTIRAFPEFPMSYPWYAATLGQLGQPQHAREILAQAQTVAPAALTFYTRARPAWFRPQDHQHLLDGLRKAGWDG